MAIYPPPAQYERCPRCGFLFQHVPPSCPQCKLFFYTPPLTKNQILWNKIGLYLVTIPIFSFATLPLAWFGTFMVEAFLAGDKIETGSTPASKAADSAAALIMIGFVILQSWFAFQYTLNKSDVKRLMEGNLDAQESIPRWIAIEFIVLIAIEFFAFHVWSHA